MERSIASLPEIPLETGTLLIGDLHLDVSPRAAPPARARCGGFLDWLAELEVPRLVILGDLFDAWVGPAHARLEGARTVLAGLTALARRGTRVDVVLGNRDFLLDGAFERASGARVFPHGLIGIPSESPRAERWLVIHGDELCTLDRSYQRLKRVLRSGPVSWAAPRIPAPMALWAAHRLRRASVTSLARKPAAETTQQLAAVLELARHQGASTLVCGHAHRFRDERPLPGLRWVVVGAFGSPHDLLRVAAGGRLEARAAVLQAGPGPGEAEGNRKP